MKLRQQKGGKIKAKVPSKKAIKNNDFFAASIS
jgi:hypothetical protein